MTDIANMLHGGRFNNVRLDRLFLYWKDPPLLYEDWMVLR